MSKMFVDVRRCIGCHACSVACKTEHSVPLGEFRTRVRWLPEPGDGRMTFLPLFAETCDLGANRAQHGLAPACVTACPTKALELVITASEEMFLNGVPFPADEKNLRLILVEKAGSRRDIPISIIADADTRHAMVVMSMDAVSQLGFKQLSIGTQKPLSGD